MEVAPEQVACSFDDFLNVYHNFRFINHMGGGKKPNAFEICTAMMDKMGRMARQVKHFERNDPKEDWPDGLTEATAGLLIYMMLLIDAYHLDIYDGMVAELKSAMKQYAKKTESLKVIEENEKDCGGSCCDENCNCQGDNTKFTR